MTAWHVIVQMHPLYMTVSFTAGAACKAGVLFDGVG